MSHDHNESGVSWVAVNLHTFRSHTGDGGIIRTMAWDSKVFYRDAVGYRGSRCFVGFSFFLSGLHCQACIRTVIGLCRIDILYGVFFGLRFFVCR